MSVPPESATAQALQNISSQATEPAHDATEPVNEWDSLLAQLATTPYEPDKWYRLVELAEGSGELPKIQAAYDGMLAAYPNTVRRPNSHCAKLY
jgi:type II secretory pathway component PulF